jgi:hypothetical protein
MTLSQKKLVISRARKKNKRQKIFITELQLLRVRKIRHSREARSRCLKQRESTGSQLFKKNGFPIKNFGNDGLKKDSLQAR